MARLTNPARLNPGSNPACDDENQASHSRSPTPVSVSSDKENRRTTEKCDKPSAMEAKARRETLVSRQDAPRKRKLGKERETPVRGTVNGDRNSVARAETPSLYDPGQDINQRRRLRKEYRDLARELGESRSEYMAAQSDGLIQTLNRSNRLFNAVKQTSDATLDSRLLVTTAEISAKRTTQMNLGESSTGVDIDDFVSKCILFMRAGPAEDDQRVPTQSRRRTRHDNDDEDGEGPGYDDGDAFNWSWLGRRACCPFNIRPPTPGFLLGPLSVQKRARRATQRRERLQARDPQTAVRPEELKAEDMQHNENADLKTTCQKIFAILQRYVHSATQQVEENLEEDMREEQIRVLMHSYGICDDGGVPLFHFVINPQSFGQTIENLFYISFLIKEGSIGLGNDSDDIITLHPISSDVEQAPQSDRQKHQSVFHLDFETWEDIVKTFDLCQCIIPHRAPSMTAPLGGRGWYA